MLWSEAKIVPVMTESLQLEIDSYVIIINPDDDMHQKRGIFKGDFRHIDGIIHSLVLLEESHKNFYTLPHTLKKIVH
tara:strand:+ start:366 stop:596 length:231 start_codon:yes stop_codon:yes gene_type:complete